MLWQTMAVMTPYAVDARAEQLGHVAVHERHVGHHHHTDASQHLSTDQEQGLHVHADEFSPPVALAPWGLRTGAPLASSTGPSEDAVEPPSVYLDGPLRPPSRVA